MTITQGSDRLVIVGASLGGLWAARGARREGFTGSIDMLGREQHLPYDRPPLSKAFLVEDGAEPSYYLSEHELRDLDVTVHLDAEATGLDLTSREVLVGPRRFGYDTLIIATGADPRQLPASPLSSGLHTLRTLDDAHRIRDLLQVAEHVVIVGAGFIGSEIASSAASFGCSSVTIVEGAEVPLVRALGPEVGRAVSLLHERQGVRLITGAQVTDVLTKDGQVSGLRLGAGEALVADLVIVGIGAVPATGWLAESGLKLHPIDRGVLCNTHLRTSDPHVFAAGDVVHWHNGLMDAAMRLENWTNAAEQGTRAALNALFPDKSQPFTTVPYFWSDWYGQRVQFVGIPGGEVTFVHGGPSESSFVALYRTGDRLTGAATLNEPRKIMKLRRLISERGSWHDAITFLGAPARPSETGAGLPTAVRVTTQ